MSAEVMDPAAVQANRQLDLLRDPVFQRLASYHLYAINPLADFRVVQKDSLAMMGCYFDLIKRFAAAEIEEAMDHLIAITTEGVDV